MLKFMSKLILLAMFVFSAPSVFADLKSSDTGLGYTIYDCGQSGSAGYQSCLNAMTLGEAGFMASYTPIGSSLPSNWQELAPPTNPCFYSGVCSYEVNAYAGSISSDGLSQVIFGTDWPTYEDIWIALIWHDNAFTYLPTGPDVSPGSNPVLDINDQGDLALVTYHETWVEGLGHIETFANQLDPGWGVFNSNFTLNDDNQVIFEGIDLSGQLDYMLVDPAGAPIPGVPEPASLALLATVVTLVIPLLSKMQLRRKAPTDRPFTRVSNV